MSARKMKEYFSSIVFSDFKFQEISREYVKKEILNFNAEKSSANGSIPVTISKQCVDVYLPFITKAINHVITNNRSDVWLLKKPKSISTNR